jgi:hypothetical protein
MGFAAVSCVGDSGEAPHFAIIFGSNPGQFSGSFEPEKAESQDGV